MMDIIFLKYAIPHYAIFPQNGSFSREMTLKTLESWDFEVKLQ